MEMVLMSALAGEMSMFPVVIDTNKTVGDLKKAIKAAKPNDLKGTSYSSFLPGKAVHVRG
ncbi:hypothetical protein PI124_g14685 [Phytophthora idaei]|nr:hypothetical protein PI125_g14441 [Phytophthora idaei]KAG3240408.1 hypothetical protein PI124_g14685 [Phytophthora idaei]